MERIHQGIGFAATFKVADEIGEAISEESTLYIVLRSPSTEYIACANSAEVGYSLNRSGTDKAFNMLTITVAATATANLTPGAYCLEIYKTDKSKMLYYKSDFAFCLPSSAAASNKTETTVDTNTDFNPDEGDDALTVQDVQNYIANKAQNNPLP